jgi:hypothetical protein
MRYLALVILFCCTFELNAQNVIDKIFGGNNTFDFGVTFVDIRNGVGFNNFKLDPSNLYFSYSRIFKKHHRVSLNHFTFFSTFKDDMPLGKINGCAFRIVGTSYSYIIDFCKFSFAPYVGISYRYFGGETADYGYWDPSTSSEPMTATVVYNSVGYDVGLDVNYFFIKNLGVGANLGYYSFPFEKGTLMDCWDINLVNPVMAETYKPSTRFIGLVFKLVVRI